MRKVLKHTQSLQSEPFFRDLAPEIVARIDSFIYHREYEPRQIIYFPDDSCDYVYWVCQGRVKVTRVSGDGRELTFRHLFPGDMLGEDVFIERAKREDYAEAMTPTMLCLMRADDFRRVAREEVLFTCAVARALSRRVVELENTLSETVFYSVRSRVASGLLRMYHCDGARSGDTLRLTHQEIANLIGSTRETTTTVLHSLRQDGIVEIANRRLTIIDPVRLELLARSG